MISGATRVAGVIGDPVRHSLSPVLHNTAYRELGLDWVYVAFEVPAGATVAAVEGARAFGLAGLSVTMPHKSAAADACDELTADAALLHSVNTVTIAPDGRACGESTDGEGFLRSVRETGHDVTGTVALVLGAGGAARAVALALGRAGAAVRVAARRPNAARDAAGPAGGDAVAWDERAAAAREADVVVNATPIGMSPNAEVPVPLGSIGPQHLVVDLVYHPIDTALLAGARGREARVVDGLGMLVHQAALQVERWTGCEAPVAAMRAAAEDALRRTPA